MTHDKAVQQQRDKKLVQYTAGLDRMADLVDFVAVATAVDVACPRADRSGKGGRPPYPTPVMVKVLFLQALYSLSGKECEHQLLDRRSFQHFCSLAAEFSIPDARTIWLFKRRLVSGGIGAKAVFEAVQQQLRAPCRAAGRSSMPPSCGRRSSSWTRRRRRRSPKASCPRTEA